MEKINKLKRLLKNNNLDGYLIPKNDEFFGEYVPDNKDNLKFISGFTGSYGFALILKNKNYLFVDGRYNIQAKIQSSKKFNIKIIPSELPRSVLQDLKLNIGFDPKLHTEHLLFRLFNKTSCKLVPINKNLVELVRKNNKKNKVKKFFFLEKKITGEGYKSKINCLLRKLKKKKVDLQFVTAPENVAWSLNIRGGDSRFTPLPNSYLFIKKNGEVILFCDLNKIDNKFKNNLKKIEFIDIRNIEKNLKKIKNKIIQIDSNSCSFFFKKIIGGNNKIVDIEDPIYFLKSIKNKIEITNTVKSHIYDGAALTKFLIWLKKSFLKKKITEIDAQEKLLQFRKKNKNFRSLSFPTISGSGPNGAIVHYKATSKSNRVLKKGDIYLVDSGGQYNFGTTDVTRTISLANGNKKIKNIYTRVLKGHIAVSNYKLKKKTCGSEVDIAARKYLKEINLDYAHGTGHGVGYFLNVHEGPQGISKGNKETFKEGVIISNEPGYYKKNKFGIRIENLITVKKNKRLLKFENLTLVPIDKTLIEKDLLDKNEILWLNNYHFKVYNNLKKLMNKSELLELKSLCSNI